MRDENFQTRIARVKTATKGQWLRILTDAGIPHEHLSKQNRPCPLCGGRDRFTFFQKTDENGRWFCRGCGYGDGLDLLQQWRHERFMDTVKYLEKYLGIPTVHSTEYGKAKKKKKDESQKQLSRLESIWEEARPLEKLSEFDPVKKYLTNRKLLYGNRSYSSELRCHSSLDYWETEESRVHERWPALLARVSDENGNLVTLHRTYLTQDGRKAPVSTQRKMSSSAGETGLIRLFPAGKTLGIAEGIETAMSAHLMDRIPVWSAVSVQGFQRLEELPQCVEKLVIYADNDRSFTGQAGAWALAKRMRSFYPELQIEVKIPEKEGTDWNDVWLEMN